MYPPTVAEPLTPDEELIHQVASYLQNRLGSQLRDFRVTIEAEGLILQGRVRTYYGKQLAQHIVMEATDLAVFANEIVVI